MKILAFISFLLLSESVLSENISASDTCMRLNKNHYYITQKDQQYSEKEVFVTDSYPLLGLNQPGKIQFSSQTTKREKPPCRKSYIIGVGGAAIIPVIGHTYIGGYNRQRGLLYTLAEGYCVLGVFAVGMSGFGENPAPEEKADRYRTWFVVIHCINIFDAYISVRRNNDYAERWWNKVKIEPALDPGGIRLVWRF